MLVCLFPLFFLCLFKVSVMLQKVNGIKKIHFKVPQHSEQLLLMGIFRINMIIFPLNSF